jgi:hypothetical protein
LADWAKATDRDGSVAVIAEILNQSNDILQDGVFVESNEATGHQVSIRTGLPPTYWRQVNEGIPPSKSTKAQVTESIGFLESRSEVDVDLADLNGNRQAFRMSEARAHIEAMNQEWAQTTFYGNTASNPEEFLGLAPRYSDLGAGNSQNILDYGGNNDTANSSIWLIVWGSETVFYIFPRGGAASGIVHRDLGEETVQQSAAAHAAGLQEPTLRMRALVDSFKIKVGLCVKDWRYAVRIANIDTAAAAGLATTHAPGAATNILHWMARAVARIPNMRMGRPAFYMNRSMFSIMQRLGLGESNNAVTVNPALTQFGASNDAMLTFMGIPIRQVDQLLTTEDDIV